MVPICRTETQTQMQRMAAWALAGGRRGWGDLRGQRCACAPARVTAGWREAAAQHLGPRPGGREAPEGGGVCLRNCQFISVHSRN